MKIANIDEAKTQLSTLIEAVLKGEDVIISQAGKPLVKMIPYTSNSQPRKPPGYWSGKVTMADDFDTLPESVINSFMSLE